MLNRFLGALAGAIVVAGLTASVCAANHSWGNYHWARTSNPFTLQLGDNMSVVGSTAGAGAVGLDESTSWTRSSFPARRRASVAHLPAAWRSATAIRVEHYEDGSKRITRILWAVEGRGRH